MPAAEIRVAILEDQRLALESLRQLFSLNGFSVVLASSRPPDFFGGLPSASPTLALVDLYLMREREAQHPEGLEVIRELQRRHPHVAVIALSGCSSDAELKWAREAGAAATIDKNTVGPDQILATVRSVLRSRSSDPLGRGDGADSMSALARLTHRELQVLRHVATGADNMKIAALLGITERTIRAHMSSLYKKLDCENRTEMAVLARTLGIQSYELGN